MKLRSLLTCNDTMIKLGYLLIGFGLSLFFIISLMLMLATNTHAEPYSPACGGAIERISKARNALLPLRRSLELSRAGEAGAFGELTVCTGGGLYSVNRALRCNEAQWQAPQRTKEVIAAEAQYRTARKAFEKLFEQARKVCLLEP